MFHFAAQGSLPTMLTKLSQMDLGYHQQPNMSMGMVWRIRGLWNTYKLIGSYLYLPFIYILYNVIVYI
jgi:hypothetical protein